MFLAGLAQYPLWLKFQLLKSHSAKFGPNQMSTVVDIGNFETVKGVMSFFFLRC